MPLKEHVLRAIVLKVAERYNEYGLTFEQWADATAYAAGMQRRDLPTDTWLRPRWRGGEDPADVGVGLAKLRDQRRGPRSGPQTIESFRGALEREFGRPESDMKYVQGVGLRWEVLPPSHSYVSAMIKRDPRGRVFVSVGSEGNRPGATYEVEGAIKLVREHRAALLPLADRRILADELNGLLRKMGDAPRAEVEDALTKAFAGHDLPFKVRDILAGNERWIHVTVSMFVGGMQNITLDRRDLLGDSWWDGGDPWPGKALAGLKKADG